MTGEDERYTVHRFSLTLVQQRCDNACPACYVDPVVRLQGGQFSPAQLETIFDEASGASSVKLLLGEVKDPYAGLVLNALHLAQAQNIKQAELVTSGINLSEQDVRKICDTYEGKLEIALSVDGPWLHDNWGPEAKNGDALSKFMKIQQDHADHVTLIAYWTHKTHPSHPEREALKDGYEQRCKDRGVPFEWMHAFEKKKPFQSATNVSVVPEGDYIFSPYREPFCIGRIGSLGTGGVRKALIPWH